MHDFIDRAIAIFPPPPSPSKPWLTSTCPKRSICRKMAVSTGFFSEWVYGTQVPRYAFKYEVQPGESGHVKIHADITQSDVDQNFAMFVPVFADFGNGMVRLGQVPIIGNSTRTVVFDLERQPKKVALNAYKEILER